jgi:hypothetical protein
MNTQTLPRLTSLGEELDLSETAFGELRPANDALNDPTALRSRMREDGYLFLRGYLDHTMVHDARVEIADRLAARGMLDANFPRIDAITRLGVTMRGDHDLARNNAPLAKLLYTGKMIELYEKLLGGPVRHFDNTWFRAVPGGGQGTYPHCDIVYMGRGTFNLYTAWTPIGDVPLEVGGLMILENSHRHGAELKNYLQRDVDLYCTNRLDAPDIESGAKTWQDWDGRLSSHPVSLREKLGGRWLTTHFQAGDVLTFSMATVHASLDNHSNRFRLSSDSRYQLASEPADERWIGPNPIGHGPAGKKGKIC